MTGALRAWNRMCGLGATQQGRNAILWGRITRSVLRGECAVALFAESEGTDMHMEQRSVGDVVVVKIVGDITLNQDGNVLLKDKLHSLFHQGYKNVLLDLGEVRHVDSAGLGELVHGYVTARNRGGALRLIQVTKRVRELFVVTKLLMVFDTYDSEADGLASFGAAATP